MSGFVLTSILLFSLPEYVVSHGYLKTPPQRSSMWRYGFNTPANHDDNGLNCGGSGVQHSRNDGKCGVCGDPYDAAVKENEAGGKYALGVIAGTYQSGQTIQAEVVITANHLGYFEFRLCPHNDKSTPVTQECLDRNLLYVGEGDSNTKFHIGSAATTYTVPVKLPPGIVCSQCVLQWTYIAGNSWGCFGGDCGKGKGPQENFVNCADIEIISNGTENTGESSATQKVTAATTTPPPSVTGQPTNEVSTSNSQSTSTKQATPTVRQQTNTNKCKGAGPWAGLQVIADWCDMNCARGFCPSSHCDCTVDTTPTPRRTCQAAGLWRTLSSISSWCDTNCNHVPPFCPSSHCTCS